MSDGLNVSHAVSYSQTHILLQEDSCSTIELDDRQSSGGQVTESTVSISLGLLMKRNGIRHQQDTVSFKKIVLLYFQTTS